MALLVGQLIEILQKYDRDREVMIHTLSGQNAEVKGYFPKDDEYFYLTDLDVKVATWRRYTYDVEAETLEEAG